MDNLNTQNDFNDASFVSLSQLLLDSPALTPQDPHLQNTHPVSDHNIYSASPSTTSSTTHVIPPKQGSRFSKETIRMLKAWLSTHENRPYPRPEDLQFLQHQTGLDSRQITTWFANARRRGYLRDSRPKSPQVHDSQSGPVDIIPRPGTPAVRFGDCCKDPLQRWVESPPEHEAASFGDIIRAVAQGPDGLSDVDCIEYNQGALCSSSSASSAGTCYSNTPSDCNSSGSQGSGAPIRKLRRRRMKKAPRPRRGFATTVLPFQCTFCVETFKTKYDWQRHEKALHLSLEKWTCAPGGARVPVSNGSAEFCCVFCGELSPDDAHLETHQYSACLARAESERGFYRKDHLVQHLRLVHKVDTSRVPLDRWVTSTLDIKSRCGFCGNIFSTWTARSDHLADHFKAGALISQWQGDWGFEEHILKRVEDSVPPYLIDFEKNTPFPLRASGTPTATPVNAYELLKLEMNFFRQNYLDMNGQPPSDQAMHLEACRTVLASEALSNGLFSTTQQSDSSWLRDLILSNPSITQEALLGPLRIASDGVSTLRIYGRTHLFEHCPLETELRAYVLTLPASPPDWHLQQEACALLRATETETDQTPFSDWALRILTSSTTWLTPFKHRTGLSTIYAATSPNTPAPIFQPQAPTPPQPPSPQPPSPQPQQPQPYAHSRSHQGPNFFRLFTADLARWVNATMSHSNPACHVPSDAEIQHHARWIMYESDDLWLQTAADHGVWLERFKKDVGIGGAVD